jgi:hypothetical protein
MQFQTDCILRKFHQNGTAVKVKDADGRIANLKTPVPNSEITLQLGYV